MNKNIFRAYDIRGIYPTELNEADAYKIGWAIFELTKCEKVGIGRDARLSAPSIQQALMKAFTDAGCQVVDFGMTSTDMVTFAAGKLDFDVTINVTASHNPKNWIGFKTSLRGGGNFGGGDELNKLAELSVNDLHEIPEKLITEVAKMDLLPLWISHVMSFINAIKIRPIKIVIDAGNGVAGPIARQFFQTLKEKSGQDIQIVEMFFEPDGNFPNHEPSPIEPKNVADLQKRVVEERADLGVAFDGDADRAFLVDEKGQIVTGSELTALVMDEILTQDSTRVVIYNAICGWNVRDVIKKHHAIAYRSKVGHGYIKKDMAKYGAYFAGEHSGHYFFKDNYNADSGLIASMVALGLLFSKNQSLSEILIEHRKYFQIPETNFKVTDTKMVLDKIANQYTNGEIDWLDGLTIRFNDYWFNVRPSSNEPLLRLNLEAKTKTLLEEKSVELQQLIES